MTQTPEITPAAPTVARAIGRNLIEVADMLRDIEPDEMNRADLLSLLRTVAAGVQLSGALLDHLADRLNAEAVERAGDMLDAAAILRRDAEVDRRIADIDPALLGDGPSTRGDR